MGGEAGDFLSAGVEFVERAEGTLDDGGDVGEALAKAVFGEGEDALLGDVDDVFGVFGVLDGLSDGVLGDGDEAAQHGLVAHDAHVVLDGGTLGHAVNERGEVCDAADGFDLFAAVELFGEGDHVDGTAGVLQVAHAGEDAAVSVEGEVVGREFGGLVEDEAVEQNGAENGALGFKAGRKSALEAVVGGGHEGVKLG